MLPTRLLSIGALLIATIAPPALAQTGDPLLDARTRDLLHESLSGERAKDHVIQISRHHRIQGSRGYRDAAQYVLQELRRAGFSAADAYIESFPSDGKWVYQTWQSSSGWHIESAELRMLEPYFMDVVVAHIRGGERGSEEIALSAHLDHPKESANDNASGSAALLDIARSLRELIAAERLTQPERSIRLVWIPEYYGTAAYMDAHPEIRGPALGGTFLANLNMDMVGENLELIHTKMKITRTPSSIPSVLNDVVENMALMVDGMDVRTPRGSQSVFNYRVTPYSGGSDHNFFIDRGIPGMMFSHDPDYTHHTSEDTPDKVDPVERSGAS